MTNPITPRRSRWSPIGRRLAVASAVLAPVGILAGAGSAAAAGSTAPPIPEGFTAVTDDTGLLTINVPAEWTDIDGNPNHGEPSVWASTDMEQYREGVGVPGVSVDVAVQQEADTAARLTAFMSEYGIDEGDCESGEPRPLTTYEGTGHGALEGTANSYQCGSAFISGFVGVAADGTGIEVFLQLPEGEDTAIADGIMQTFTYGDVSMLSGSTIPGGSGLPGSDAPVTAATAPVATVAPAPAPVPTAAPVPVSSSVPATTVAGVPAAPGALAGQVAVTDETGRLTIQVPAGWVDSNVADLLGDPSIWAAEDLGVFGTTLAASGVEFNVSGLVVTDPAAYAVTQAEYGGIVDLAQCTEVAPAAAYTSPQTAAGVYTGAIVRYDCAGTLVTSVVAVSPDGSSELDVFIRLAPGTDPAVADNILATFTLA